MKFSQTGLAPEVMQAIESVNFNDMTPVQEQTIPVILQGRDLIACAQTGTGKTAAYVLPLLDKLQREGNPDNHVKSLIIVPTRELAQQIDVQLQGFSYFLPVSTTVVHGSGGGIDWSWQKQGMISGSDIIVATPGRLLAHIDITSGLDFSHVEYFVLDEADRMLDMGFWDDIMKIIDQLPKERQTLMFSATLPPKIREMARKVLRNPEEINIAVSRPNEAIEQSALICYENQKPGIIRELFDKPTGNKTIIFASSKIRVKELAFTLKRMKLNVAAMHSDLDQPKREEVMLDFKNGKIDILVATDVVARGIDIEDIGLVINYEVPREVEDYVHRIGRTARAGAAGAAITLVGEKEQGKFRRVEEFLGREVPKGTLPEAVGEGPAYSGKGGDEGRGGRGGRSSRGRGAGQGGGRARAEGRAEARTEEKAPAADQSKRERGQQRRERPVPAGVPQPEAQPAAAQAPATGEQFPDGARRHGRRHSSHGRRPGGEGRQQQHPEGEGASQRTGQNRASTQEGKQGGEGNRAAAQGNRQGGEGSRNRGGRNRSRRGPGQSAAAQGGQRGAKPEVRQNRGAQPPTKPTPHSAPAPKSKSFIGRLLSFGRKK